ncbi:EmrB/QacA subfamily drug resistance transporter [Kibdelosporangium banguiense]|uniref:EmrB/QacA subfamily drug resistance transporter n=1 Tax=Kibdelosporangium banguiense TaxID=1365924 RepID=A0ABS4TSE2_9PSEU|nr:DHA2 family efflux MFS transporter permease subunit [Kibdelosporangium banguiense]MBP2326855.1 EmrB/QacA subfamily drug resistance transporter [Kibdelosporangium banguiense]
MKRRDTLEPLGAPLIRLALVLVLGAVAPLLDTTIASVALRTLAAEFGVGTAAIGWVSTAYLLAMAVTIPASGWLTDRFGTKRVWLGALLVFTVGSAGAGMASGLGTLIAFRCLQGIGAGLVQPVILTALVRAAGPGKLGRVLTIVTFVAVLVPIVGPVAGGLILADASWRWIFYVNIPLCVLAIVMAWIVIPGARTGEAEQFDALGLALLSPALAGILFGLSRATAGFGSVDVLLPLSGGLLLLGAYVVRGLRGNARHLVGLRLLRIRSFAAAGSVQFFSGLSLYGAMFLLPLYYQQVRGQGALAAGLLLAPQGVGALLVRPVGGIVDRIGASRIVRVGVLVCAIATVPFVFAGAHTSEALLACALVVRGAGLSAANIAVMTGAFRDVPRDDVSDASTLTRMLQQIGGAFGTAVLAVSAAGGAFHTAFLWSVLLSVLAFVPALLMTESP